MIRGIVSSLRVALVLHTCLSYNQCVFPLCRVLAACCVYCPAIFVIKTAAKLTSIDHWPDCETHAAFSTVRSLFLVNHLWIFVEFRTDAVTTVILTIENLAYGLFLLLVLMYFSIAVPPPPDLIQLNTRFYLAHAFVKCFLSNHT